MRCGMAKQNSEKSLQLFLRILSYLKPYYRHIIMILVFNFMFIIFNTISIWMVAPFISTLFESNDTVVEQQIAPEKSAEGQTSILNLNTWLKERMDKLFRRENRVQTLKLLCFFIFFSFFLKNAFRFAESWWVSFVEQKVIKDLRDEVYEYILFQPLAFYSSYQIGNLISRITNDITALNVALNQGFTRIIRDPLIIIIFLTLLVSISWQLTLVALFVFPVTGFMITKVGYSLKRKSKRVQERIADVTTVLQETISGIKVVKAFSMEKYENDKFRDKTNSHFRAVLRQSRLDRLSNPLSETLGIGVMVAVLWFGGQLVLSGELISSEDFIRFIAVLFAVMDPIKTLGQLNNNAQMALASGKRIFAILDTPIAIADKADAINKTKFEKSIHYKDVFFKYDNKSDIVLNGINVEVSKNQKIAIVGSSGSGKTTMLNLLPRFYDLDQGSIKIDGIDIRDMSQQSLRKLMGIVTQEVILFNDTVAKNIAYGESGISQKKIEQAARLANAYDFIMEMPEKFETLIGERGMRLSGGQRQRLSIARAILKDPPILIFDEATSSLDSESERLIQQAIENLMKNRTVFIIAHRLSSIINADRILVLEKGKITDEGTHEELLESSSRYRHLYKLQFAG